MGQVASLRDVELSAGDLLQLLKISGILIDVFAHDGNALLTVINGYSYMSHEIVTETLSETTQAPDLNQLETWLLQIKDAGERLGDLLTLCLSFKRLSSQNPSAAVSHIYAIFSTVAKSYPNHAIDFGKSSKDLEVVYPGPLLFGIMTGLLGNGIRHGGSEAVDIKVDWQVEEDRLVLNVQDSGKGISSLPVRGMVPIEQLGVLRLSGLALISKIAIGSGGLLLFGRSNVLGGLHVHLEIPVPYFADSVNHGQPSE